MANELNDLFSSYPLSELILLIITILAAGKGLWSLLEFWFSKIDIHLGEKYKKQERWENLDKKIDSLVVNLDHHIDGVSNKIEELKIQNEQTHKHQEQMDKTLALVQERLQETARSYLIDAHHKFCYDVKQIDDLSLQSIERRYLYYKTAGGDTFIDYLMEEIRELPRVGYYKNNNNNTSLAES